MNAKALIKKWLLLRSHDKTNVLTYYIIINYTKGYDKLEKLYDFREYLGMILVYKTHKSK